MSGGLSTMVAPAAVLAMMAVTQRNRNAVAELLREGKSLAEASVLARDGTLVKITGEDVRFVRDWISTRRAFAKDTGLGACTAAWQARLARDGVAVKQVELADKADVLLAVLR